METHSVNPPKSEESRSHGAYDIFSSIFSNKNFNIFPNIIGILSF